MCQQKYGCVDQHGFYRQIRPEYVVFLKIYSKLLDSVKISRRGLCKNKWELMTDTRKKWFKAGTVFGMVPDGVPSEKTEKFSNF